MKNLILLITFIFTVGELKAQTGTTAVRITNSPTVSVSGTTTVSVSNSPTVFLAANQVVQQGTTTGTVIQATRSITTSASRCTVTGSAAGANRKKLCMTNMNSSNQCYFGNSAVALTSGVPIPRIDTSSNPPQPLCFEYDSTDYYCICSGITDVRVLEAY